MENRVQTKIVHTELGDIRGFIQQGIIKFTAIPYCQPPTGKARFRPVKAPVPWDGVLDATRQSPMCPQGPSDLEKAMGALDYPIAEDSLTLSISTPSTEGKHPVAVWFHGGANMSGAGNIAWYDGENLARQGNAVVVGVNFRIGALGFLYHPLLNTANLSILDQIEALRWIQKNIRAFGGDPNNVTVFGQSAGANAIVHMMALKETKGLFHKVILQSPSLGRGNHTTIDAMRIAECHFKHLDLDRNDSNLPAKIREKSIHAILKATESAYSEMGAEFGGMLFKPVSDEWARPEAAIEAAANEASRRQLRILIGTTADELQAFIQPKNKADVMVMRRLQYERYDEPDNQFALLAAQGGCLVWKYRFTWKAPESIFGSCHTLELPFVFGTLAAWAQAPMLKGATLEEKRRLSETMQRDWCRFFNTGGFDECDWPRFSEGNGIHKIYDNLKNGCQSFRIVNP